MAQVFRCAVPVVPVWAGMGMYGGAVPGDSKVLLWYETAFHGRQDGCMVKKLLKALLKVERDILPVHESFFDGLGDLVLCLLSFLVPAFTLPSAIS